MHIRKVRGKVINLNNGNVMSQIFITLYLNTIFIFKVKLINVLLCPKSLTSRVLPDAEKIEFVSKSVAWIQGHGTMDACFVLNYGYEAPLPWPQVRLELTDSGNGKKIVPQTYGMAVPRACTIVIIAGKLNDIQGSSSKCCLQFYEKLLSNEFPSLGKYLDRVDTVMAQVDRITEDIAHMPVAAFIFRDKESDKISYSINTRLIDTITLKLKIINLK